MDPIAVVAFDVGETLIDETRIWSRWAARLGVTRLTMMGLIGAMIATERPHEQVFQIIRPGFDIHVELSRWREEDPDGLRESFDAEDLYPDVRPALAALQRSGRRLIIAGNQPPQAGAALEAMGLPVEAILISDQLGRYKPDAAFFEAVADATGVAAERTAYVGDRLDNDVLPARNAGMRAVLLRRGPWGYLHAARRDARQADIVTDSLTDLPALLDALHT